MTKPSSDQRETTKLHIGREKINEANRQILAAYKLRQEGVSLIGEHKIAHDLTVNDPEREQMMIASLRQTAVDLGVEISDDDLMHIFDPLLELSRRLQLKNGVRDNHR